MKFSIDIELGNDAMQTPGDVARALEGLARYLGSFDFDEAWHTDAGALRDVNGNTVGTWTASDDIRERTATDTSRESWGPARPAQFARCTTLRCSSYGHPHSGTCDDDRGRSLA